MPGERDELRRQNAARIHEALWGFPLPPEAPVTFSTEHHDDGAQITHIEFGPMPNRQK